MCQVPSGCRWIDGEVRGGNGSWSFCNEKTVDGVWCKEHRRQVYPPRGSNAAEHAEAGQKLCANKGGGKGCAHYIDPEADKLNL